MRQPAPFSKRWTLYQLPQNLKLCSTSFKEYLPTSKRRVKCKKNVLFKKWGAKWRSERAIGRQICSKYNVYMCGNTTKSLGAIHMLIKRII
jgi:uncharacterized FlgJ-related protein